ncbi:hypothetical protein C3709_03980 [Lelliottia aquatilis]|uniref:Secreted protein n=1 Tax=Lelliottia aquatilis TaxID=2080838 RepID=A0ABX5A566_9ENTR|nr:hypothetical protein C3Z09_09515 [Lelliottia aquatilis]POZ29050.1 hypothetical protein C3708_03980 [Lelliottia sp. 7254-16]POZ25894.1 hypothetical protein C3712_03980 [Lelliottia aquatilis]POZ29448.1 hypothetical protein C3711_05210 [Lelliottia aquatilis]POZ33355.1 hypothetical protein C3710_07970 [Lelliottia aquatilis]
MHKHQIILVLHFILRVASALAAPSNPRHIVNYAPGDFQACRLDAPRMILCKRSEGTRYNVR